MANAVSAINKQVLLEDRLYFFVMRKNLFIKRYTVLTRRAVFIYRSQTSFRTEPEKPLAIVPFQEIRTVLCRQIETC